MKKRSITCTFNTIKYSSRFPFFLKNISIEQNILIYSQNYSAPFTSTWRFPFGIIWYRPPVICSPSFLQVIMGSGLPLVIQVNSMSRPSATLSSRAGGTIIAGSSSVKKRHFFGKNPPFRLLVIQVHVHYFIVQFSHYI